MISSEEILLSTSGGEFRYNKYSHNLVQYSFDNEKLPKFYKAYDDFETNINETIYKLKHSLLSRYQNQMRVSRRSILL